MEDFNDMILNSNLHDIGFSGDAFTWNQGTLWQRLDRILFNNVWINKHQNTHIEHLSHTLSDHAPLLAFNFLSFGGRLVLIKSVLCSILIYLFHTLNPTMNICMKLERMFNKFLWGAKVGKSAILWASWKNCSGVQEEGKLGFKTLTDMAYCFSFKLWFNMRSNISLWSKFMIKKYCVGKHPLNGFFKKGDSTIWKRLCTIKWEEESFIQWGLGCGNIFFWQDNWLGCSSIDNLLNTRSNSICKVAEFYQDGAWNLPLLAEMVPNFILNLILDVPLQIVQKYCILFNKSNDGSFAIKEVWHSIRSSQPKSNIFSNCWQKVFLLPTLFFYGGSPTIICLLILFS
ncbi:Putative ribonuclease H protein [Dendrobium catenatum]|uniref:Ribonuclease H protein n=1 Tax=Dendrobium catenatum TaxID=906689 RepID=A0A2I0VCN1_9ASPA|nr:Putative ribonuclease H protein [Dendrobium catenatum]